MALGNFIHVSFYTFLNRQFDGVQTACLGIRFIVTVYHAHGVFFYERRFFTVYLA